LSIQLKTPTSTDSVAPARGVDVRRAYAAGAGTAEVQGASVVGKQERGVAERRVQRRHDLDGVECAGGTRAVGDPDLVVVGGGVGVAREVEGEAVGGGHRAVFVGGGVDDAGEGRGGVDHAAGALCGDVEIVGAGAAGAIGREVHGLAVGGEE